MAVKLFPGPAVGSRGCCVDGSYCNAAAPPGFDQYLCFGEAVEDLAVEQFIAKRPVEALVIAILPRRSRGDGRGMARVGVIGRSWRAAFR